MAANPTTVIVIIVALLVILSLVLAVLAFWIAMIIDCCKRKFNNGLERLIWLLVLLFTNLLGMIIYFFLITKYHPDGLVGIDGKLQ